VYRFKNLEVKLDASGRSVPGGEQKALLTGQGMLNLDSGKFALDDVQMQAAGLNASATLTGHILGKAPALNGQLTVAEFNPRQVLDRLGISPPPLQGDNVLQQAALKMQFAGTPSSAKISKMR